MKFTLWDSEMFISIILQLVLLLYCVVEQIILNATLETFLFRRSVRASGYSLQMKVVLSTSSSLNNLKYNACILIDSGIFF